MPWQSASAWVSVHRWFTGGVLALIALFAIAAGVTLPRDAGPRLLLDDSADAARTTALVESRFGSEPVAIVVEKPLAELLTAEGMATLRRLEREVARTPGVKSVFGPATLVQSTVSQIPLVIRKQLAPRAAAAERAAREARRVARSVDADQATTKAAEAEARLRSLGSVREQYDVLFDRFAVLGVPSAKNAAFVQALMLGAGGAPKDRLRWLLPDDRHALVLVRLDSSLQQDQLEATAARLERLAGATRTAGLDAKVVGAPLVAAAVARDLSGDLLNLLPVVLAAMVLLLALRRRVRPRRGVLVLPGLIGAAAAVLASWAFGLGLTPATLAALPVVLGLGVDFSVQLDAAFRAARRRKRAEAAARAALAELAAPLTRSLLAIVAGFAVLLLSPVPLVQRLGVLLAVGAAASFVAAMVMVPALLRWADPARRPSTSVGLRVARTPRPAAAVVAVALLLLAGGVVAAERVPLDTDPQQLAQPDQPELALARAASETFGAGGQVRIAVTGRDVTTPEAVAWMSDAQARIARIDARLRRGPSLAELATAGGRLADATSVRRMLEVVPTDLAAAVVDPRRRLTEFTYSVPPLDAEDLSSLQRRIDAVLATAPQGLSASAGGLVPVVTSAVDEIKDGRPWLMLAAATAAFLLLLPTGPRRAAVVVLPAVAAAASCSLVIKLTGIRLSPLSATLEPLVVAIAVEFSILVEHRADRLRAGGARVADAATSSVRDMAPGVLTSAATVAGGFAVLLLSDVPVLQQFGLVAALEVSVAAVFALVVTPALWVLTASGLPRRWPSRRPSPRSVSAT